MRVLVSGGAGFIGSHLVHACLEAGEQVRVLDDLSSGHRENLAAVSGDVELVEASVVDPDAVCRAAAGCEVVYHLAAVASVPRSVEDPVGTHAVNATGTLHALEAARRAGARFVLASSAAVYGDEPSLPASEDLEPRPRSPYAIHKLVGELYCRRYGELWDVQAVALRNFNVFGPRQDPASMYAGVIPLFATAVARGCAPRIFGDGKQTRDFVYVADVVAAFRAAARAGPEAAGLVLNVGRGERTSLLELLSAIARVLDRPLPEPVFEASRAGDVRHSQADVQRASRVLDWHASRSLEEGLVDTVQFYLEGAA